MSYTARAGPPMRLARQLPQVADWHEASAFTPRPELENKVCREELETSSPPLPSPAQLSCFLSLSREEQRLPHCQVWGERYLACCLRRYEGMGTRMTETGHSQEQLSGTSGNAVMKMRLLFHALVEQTVPRVNQSVPPHVLHL